LRAYRKRSGLSKDDIAFLLGCKSATALARYESCSRAPQLRSALALEVILHAHVCELFAGIHEDAEREVADRARTLARIAGSTPSVRRTATLSALAAKSHEEPEDDVVWEPN
jgi:transcriptional regulator with XRE-family HTH domain